MNIKKKLKTGLILVLAFTGIAINNAQAQSHLQNDKKQETLKLPKTLTEEELKFLGSHDHRAHATGGFKSNVPLKGQFGKPPKYEKKMDQAWTVMLLKQGLISNDEAKIVLAGLEKAPRGGENTLKQILDGDEHHASLPQLGRTLQEPMARMSLREKQLDFIDATHVFLEALQNAIEKHAETIMPGMTHMAHSQPTTYAAYLLALHDEIQRGLEYIELAYVHTNENSGGCGATSGTGWPIDRYMVTELLGFDKLLEPTYAGEAAQDWAMNTLFALSNMMLTISRTAMDHGIWGMDGVNTHEVPYHLGTSSLMPQKAHSGSSWERVRIVGNNILGLTMIGVFGLHGEPYSDVLTSYQASYRTYNKGAIGALEEAESLMYFLTDIIKTMDVDKEKLLQDAREGWGSTPDLAIKLIREKDYGTRQAHRICAVMVRIARHHRKIKPLELTGTMLDEAARISNDPEPHLTTEEIHEIMDPEKFVERHDNIGDPHPKETFRMLEIRKKDLKKKQQEQSLRRERVENGYQKLRTEIDRILEK